jgi:hypothetical protein
MIEQDLMNQTSDVAHRLARLRCLKSVVDGPVRYELRLVDCRSLRCLKCGGNTKIGRHPTHGPYWYLVARSPATRRRVTVYIGKKLDTTIYRTEKGQFDDAAYALRKRPLNSQPGTEGDAPSPN